MMQDDRAMEKKP